MFVFNSLQEFVAFSPSWNLISAALAFMFTRSMSMVTVLFVHVEYLLSNIIPSTVTKDK